MKKQNYTQKTSKNTNTNPYFIYGKHAVNEALKNKNRKIIKLFLTQEIFLSDKNLYEKFPHEIIEKKYLEKILDQDASHQGIAVKVHPLEHDHYINNIKKINNQNSLIVILDQITDPHNFGSIIRSAYAFGADLIIIPEDNSPPENAIVAKTSSGSLEKVTISKVTNISNTIAQLKQEGYWVVGLDSHAKQTIYNSNLSGKICVILGSEGKGMRRLTKENCDFLLSIPINPDAESINVSNAAAIIFASLSKFK